MRKRHKKVDKSLDKNFIIILKIILEVGKHFEECSFSGKIY